jgi:hypothetical protein
MGSASADCRRLPVAAVGPCDAGTSYFGGAAAPDGMEGAEPKPHLTPRARRLERVAAWASLGAGAVHGLLVRDHFEEWWGYGLFFLLAGLVQLLFGLALLTDAVNPRDTGAQWHRVRRAVYAIGLVGNVGLVALYVVTRTTGIPFLGPEAGEVEAVSPIDLVAKALEAVAVVALALLLRAPVQPSHAEGGDGGRPAP